MKIPIVSERTGEVWISFRHVLHGGEKDRLFSEATVGWVGANGEEKVYKGLAYVHPNDTPVRKTGRKIALARALQWSGLSRAERKQVWIGLMGKGMRV